MEEKYIKIAIPEGKAYEQTVDEKGNIILKLVDVKPIRSKNWEEFCKNHPDIDVEYFLRSDSSVDKFTRISRRIDIDKNLLATKEDAEGILALIQLTRLHDEWVGDWKPDYTTGEIKYSIAVIHNKIQIEAFVSTKHFLTFRNEKLAQEFFKCFRDLIERAKKFI